MRYFLLGIYLQCLWLVYTKSASWDEGQKLRMEISAASVLISAACWPRQGGKE